MRGVVVIGEGEKDEAPMLYNGEEVGAGDGPEVDVAVDPLEGTRLTSSASRTRSRRCLSRSAGRCSSRAPRSTWTRSPVARGGRRGRPRPVAFRQRARGREGQGRLAERGIGRRPRPRPRHEELIAELRDVGAKVLLIPDGDVAPGDRGRAAGHRRGPADGRRRDARGRAVRGGAQVRRRRSAGELWPRTTRSARSSSTRASTSSAC